MRATSATTTTATARNPVTLTFAFTLAIVRAQLFPFSFAFSNTLAVALTLLRPFLCVSVRAQMSAAVATIRSRSLSPQRRRTSRSRPRSPRATFKRLVPMTNVEPHVSIKAASPPKEDAKRALLRQLEALRPNLNLLAQYDAHKRASELRITTLERKLAEMEARMKSAAAAAGAAPASGTVKRAHASVAVATATTALAQLDLNKPDAIKAWARNNAAHPVSAFLLRALPQPFIADAPGFEEQYGGVDGGENVQGLLTAAIRCCAPGEANYKARDLAADKLAYRALLSMFLRKPGTDAKADEQHVQVLIKYCKQHAITASDVDLS